MEPNKRSSEDSAMESTEEEEIQQIKAQKRNEPLLSESKEDIELSPAIRRRLHALKNLQLKVTNLDAEFYKEVHALEVKYMKLYYPYLDKRAEIITGRYEPNDEECEWESETETEDAITDGVQKTHITDKKDGEVTDEPKGIPEFWLIIFKNVSLLREMVQEHDEPILEYLEDIKVIMLENDPMGFVLEFHFAKNEYFTNSVLTKEYHMKCQPDTEHPFDFEGPEIYKCTGCSIMWCKDKNVTVKTIRKRQKHKSRGAVRTIVKTVPTDSFFNFFNPPELPLDPTADVADDIKNLLTTDFEIGHYLRERVVPSAVLLYTGEGLDEEEDYDEDEEEEESSEENSSEEDEVKPVVRKRVGAKGGKHQVPNEEKNEDDKKEVVKANTGGRGGKGGRTPSGNAQPPNPANPAECKPQ